MGYIPMFDQPDPELSPERITRRIAEQALRIIEKLLAEREPVRTRTRERKPQAEGCSMSAAYLGRLMRDGILSPTEARIVYGSASVQERLGHRFPRLFKKWATDNARRDRQFLDLQEWPQRMRTSMESALDEQRRFELADVLGVPRD